MKNIISLFSLSLLLASPIIADEMVDAYRALAHDSQSHSSAGVKVATVLIPTLSVQYAKGCNTKDTVLALEVLLADIFGQAAFREVADRNDTIAMIIKTLTNRFSIATVTAATMLLLKNIKADSCNVDVATQIIVAQLTAACLLQKVDQYLNEETYAERKLAKKEKLKARA